MPRISKKKKVFVLDTSVILYDHRAFMEFAEHDVAIPISVLEELDNFKKGSDTKNFEARQFIRALEEMASQSSLQDWQPLRGEKKGMFRVVMSKIAKSIDANQVFMGNKMDHQIINAALTLKEEEPKREVILVTKDINLRLKARALNMQAEDYETGKVKDVERLHKGNAKYDNFPQTFIDALHKKGFVELEKILSKVSDFAPIANQYFVLTGSKSSALAFYNAREERLELVEKRQCYGIKPRNAEQAFALHAVMHPDIKLVSLSGVAGTGKTLLALAAALEQRREYRQVYLSRPIVPLSNRDLGYLPGDMKAKVDPYMQALWDNLKHIKNQFKESDKEFRAIDEMVQSEKIVVTPLAYIRGRSLSNVIFIVDEAQNLTPHEIKTVITRAGENAKFIFTGDVFQIDTPYLDEQSNGLSYMIDKLSGNDLFSSVLLEKGERSELANVANALL
ncbi:MAG: PhoH family protein [Flavobacteriales bacterium]|nr:MAG: PhoH family protein [Flavobacteriales bacterium]